MSHSQSLINQITLDCLLNREMMANHLMKQREKQIQKEKVLLEATEKKKVLNIVQKLN